MQECTMQVDETLYWLELLYTTHRIDLNTYTSLSKMGKEIRAMTVASLKTARKIINS